jgi:hypothetical protein
MPFLKHLLYMKYFISILFFSSLCNNIFAQTIELEGAYGASFLGAERIEFKGTDSFYFNGFYCTEGVSGRGVCEIRSGYLYLYFSKEPKVKEIPAPETLVVKDSNTTSGSSIIHFRLFETDKITPVSYMSISVKGKKTGVAADRDGHAGIKLNLSSFPVVFELTGVGYERKEVKITSPGNYTVNAFFLQNGLPNTVLSNGEISQYELGEVHEDWFEARPAGSKGGFRIYRRKPGL